MKHVDAKGARIAYDERGPETDVTLVCLPGWGVSRSFFAPLAERLASKWRVVTLDWRGHGDSERPREDFGHAELAEDALAVIEATRSKRVVPIAQAHGGWVAIELRRRLGARVPAIVSTSWLLLDPPPPFSAVLAALRDEARWRGARDELFSMWLTGAPQALAQRVRDDMGSYDFAVWARAGREIAADYARWGSPLRALAAMSAPPAVRHLYSQPRTPEFLAAQEAFGQSHDWFSVRRLEAVSHFPPLEVPEVTAAEIDAFVAQ